MITENDLNALMELYSQLSPTNVGLADNKREIIWSEIERNKNITYLGMFDDNRLISSCFIAIIPNFTNQGKSIGYIENVITDVKYRRKGIGKKIILKAIEIAEKSNCYKVFLESGINRKEAHMFYKSIGFDDTNKKAFNIRF